MRKTESGFVRIAATILGGLLLFVVAPSVAQAQLLSDDVIASAQDAGTARTMAALWTAIDHRAHRVQRRGSEHWVRRDLGERESRQRLPSTIVPIDDLRSAIRRLFGVIEHQAVVELALRTEPNGSASVEVDVDADVAALVILGEGAHDAPMFSPPPPWTQADGPGYAVRGLGRRARGTPLVVPVPDGVRVLLVTRVEPIALETMRSGHTIYVSGIPDDPRYRVVATLDTQPVTLDEGRRFELPASLGSGFHTLEVQLVERRTGEQVAWTRRTFPLPVRYELVLTAGERERCVTLRGEAVAERGRMRRAVRASRLIRMRYEPGAQEEGLLGDGTRICAATPLFGWAGRWTHHLSGAPGHVPSELHIETRQQSELVTRAVPLTSWVVFALLLAWGWWPRRGPRVTHVAWTRAPNGGYRGLEPSTWHVTRLPGEETPLSAVDPALQGVEHTVASVGNDARLGLTHPVVVRRGPDGPTTLRIYDIELPAGSQVVDGGLHLALVTDASAQALRNGGTLHAPSAEDLQGARDRGLVDEVVVPKPSRARRAVAIAVGALFATTAPFVPFVVGASLWPGARPFTDTLATWLTGFGVSALVVLGVAIRSQRRQRAKADGRSCKYSFP